MRRKLNCKVCGGQLQGHDAVVKTDICFECHRSKNPNIIRAVKAIQDEYKRRYDEASHESEKALWKYDILGDSEKIRFRVYYVDYGINGITYSTDPINTIEEATTILENRIANGIDVQAIIVEEKITIREIKPKKKIT